MSNLDKAIKLLSYANLPGRTLHPRQVEAIVTALEAAGLLAPDAQIIRTVKELEALDPDMILMNKWGDLFDPDNIYSGIGLEEDHDYYFPCVLVATGTQVRYARETLEEENE